MWHLRGPQEHAAPPQGAPTAHICPPCLMMRPSSIPDRHTVLRTVVLPSHMIWAFASSASSNGLKLKFRGASWSATSTSMDSSERNGLSSRCMVVQGQLTGGVPLDIRGASYIVAMAGPPGCESSGAPPALPHRNNPGNRLIQNVSTNGDCTSLSTVPTWISCTSCVT